MRTIAATNERQSATIAERLRREPAFRAEIARGVADMPPDEQRLHIRAVV